MGAIGYSGALGHFFFRVPWRPPQHPRALGVDGKGDRRGPGTCFLARHDPFGRILPTLTPLPQCLQLNQDGHETRSQCLQLSLVMVRDSEEAEEEEAEAEEEEEEEEDDRRR